MTDCSILMGQQLRIFEDHSSKEQEGRDLENFTDGDIASYGHQHCRTRDHRCYNCVAFDNFVSWIADPFCVLSILDFRPGALLSETLELQLVQSCI